MAASEQPDNFRWVVSVGNEEVDPSLRRAIRSHVMLGKNSRKPRKATLQRRIAAKRLSPILNTGNPQNEIESNESSEGALPALAQIAARSPRLGSFVTIPRPRNLGWRVGPLRLADDVESGAVETFLRFSWIAKHVLFALEPCIFFDRRGETWIAPLTFDPVFLHTMICTSHHYFDAVATRMTSAVSKTTQYHHSKAIRLLRERLAQGNAHSTMSDTTITALMALTGHAFITRDFDAASNRVQGMHKIVRIRGGLTALANTKICVEILRCDLGLALHRGSRPVFFSDDTPQCALLAYPEVQALFDSTFDVRKNQGARIALGLSNVHQELIDVWDTLSSFCSLVRKALEQQKLITLELHLDVMAAVMYRLLRLEFQPRTWEEILRLSLLAFTSSIFLQWRSLGASYTHLADELRVSLSQLSLEDVSSTHVLWALVISATSVFDSAEYTWLLPLIDRSMLDCGAEGWVDVKEFMISTLWIESIHDLPGRGVVSLAVQSRA